VSQAGKPSRVKVYVQAARLRTLPLASASVLTAGALVFETMRQPAAVVQAGAQAGTAPLLPLAAALLTVWLLQIMANFANDLGDAEHGADDHRQDRTVASGAIDKRQMKLAVVTLAVLALISGLATIWLAGASWLWALLGLGAMLGAYRYTAGDNPYGYAGWGDAAVVLFFGLLGVVGIAALITNEFHATWLLPAWTLGAFATAVLNLNNLRDHSTDAVAGKRTLIVQHGFSWGVRYHGALLASGWLALGALFLAMPGTWRGAPWYLLMVAVHFQHYQRVRKCKAADAATLDSELGRVALSTTVVALFLFLSQFNP
jgi:1,4-dihydroxy-2-naphthoate octaprenyltransferase